MDNDVNNLYFKLKILSILENRMNENRNGSARGLQELMAFLR